MGGSSKKKKHKEKSRKLGKSKADAPLPRSSAAVWTDLVTPQLKFYVALAKKMTLLEPSIFGKQKGRPDIDAADL